MNQLGLKTGVIAECRRQAINRLKEFNVKPVYIALSGSHLYGFPSKDSDVDVRCCHIIDTKDLFHITKGVPYIETLKGGKTIKQMRDKTSVLQWDSEMEFEDRKILLEFESMEIQKTIGLAMSNNSNVLEHIFSKNFLTSPPTEFMRLKELTKQSISKIVCKPYRGLAEDNYKKFIDSMNPTYRDKLVKKYLYVIRAYLVGTYALQTGEIEPSILFHLKKEWNYDSKEDRILIHELIDKKEDAEYQITAIDHKRCREVIARLKARMEIAIAESRLPDKPSNQEAWDDFLYNVRLRNL